MCSWVQGLEMGKRARILFLANYPADVAPGQRYRFEQYIPYLESRGFECAVSPLFSLKDLQYLKLSGFAFKKIVLTIKSIWKRLKEVLSYRNYDIIFIYREALFVGPPIIEWYLSKLKVKTILDFDDAIWMYEDSSAGALAKLLRFPQKTKYIINNVDQVIVGNKYLAEFCQAHSKSNVAIIPSTIDLNVYKFEEKAKEHGSPVVVGWTGSPSTVKHYEIIMPALIKLKDIFKDRIEFVLIGEPNYIDKDLGIIGREWKSKTEVSDLKQIDIGLMPLPDDEWTRGKCGMKALQYMALGIPAVVSPVGANTNIILDGVNGFWAREIQDWVEVVSKLVENPELRKRIGLKGREAVSEKFSTQSQQEEVAKIFENLINGN